MISIDNDYKLSKQISELKKKRLILEKQAKEYENKLELKKNNNKEQKIDNFVENLKKERKQNQNYFFKIKIETFVKKINLIHSIRFRKLSKQFFSLSKIILLEFNEKMLKVIKTKFFKFN